MRRVDGVVLEGQDVALASVLVRLGVAHLQRVNGAVMPDALALRDRITAFAREPASVQVEGGRETANPGAAATVAVSAPQMTVRDAAALLVLTEQRVRALCRSGALAATRDPGGHWRIDGGSLAALAAWRKERDD